MKIFLTGGGGFIGRHIREQLGEKYNLLAPSHSELDMTDGPAVYAYLEKHKPDIILHAATLGGNRKKQYSNIAHQNLQMFFNIIRGKEFFGHLITFGSGVEYDRRQPVADVAEDDYRRSIPVDEYAFAKYVMARFAEEVDYITHLRFYGVYGRYEDYETRFISNAMCKAILGMPITMKQDVYFDYVYAPDVVRQIEFFLNSKPKHKLYNLGRGEKINLKFIAERIIALTGKNTPVTIAVPGLNKEYSCSIKRFLEENPGFIFTDFDKTLKELIAYYTELLPNIDKSVFLTDV